MIDHNNIISEVYEQFATVMDESPDGVYLWLDDENKICNKNMAEMFGITVDMWQKESDFLNKHVAEEDRESFANYYQKHVENLSYPAKFTFNGLKSDGSFFSAETYMIPISWDGHAVAYHFVREVK